MQTNVLDKKNIEDMLSLTPMQEGMLFFYLKNPKSDLYFEQLSLRLSGEIDHQLFEKAWNFVVESNEMLRTVFRWEKLKNPTQVVLKEHPVTIRYIDVAAGTQSLEEIKAADKQEKFDLREVPFRVTLCQYQPAKYEMIISNHHILYDGWSNGVILKEFFTSYETLKAGKQLSKTRKMKFKEYLQWLHEQDKGQQEKFWEKYFAGFDTPTALPVKGVKRSGGRGINTADSYKSRFSKEFTGKLETYCKQHKATIAALLYTGWGILLQKYNSATDIVFGTTVASRNAQIKGIEEAVGLFINTVPLRVQADSEETPLALLGKINEALQIRETYESASLVEVKEWSPIDSSEELFDTLLVIENYPLDEALEQEGKAINIEGFSIFEMTNYDLTLGITLGDEIEVNYIYNPEVLDKEIIERLSSHFQNILTAQLEQEGQVLGDIKALSSAEQQQLLVDFNKREKDFLTAKTIPQLFLEQVQRTPGKLALTGTSTQPGNPSCSFTFSELNEISSRVSDYLVEKVIKGGGEPKKSGKRRSQQGKAGEASKGGGHGLIAIMVDRTVEMIIGIIGILKTGCGYVPLNPKAPASRNKYIKEECGVKYVLTSQEIASILGQSRESGKQEKFQTCDYIDELTHGQSENEEQLAQVGQEPVCCDKEDQEAVNCVAYVIFTSGSTGKPKGVPITHRNFCPLMHWGYHHMKIEPADKVVQNLSYYFDWSVWEIFITLTSGASLHMVTEDIMLNPEAYADFLIENEISVLHITPTQFQTLTDTGQKLQHMRHLAIGAEKLTLDLVQRAHTMVSENCRVYNMYGPTEATIMAAVLDIEKEKEEFYKKLSSIPIGPPISNTEFYILDPDMNPTPINVPGELFIGGDGLTSGYLNNKKLTEQVLVPVDRNLLGGPLTPGSTASETVTLYRTGDLACWLADGTVEFIGRIDQQVKIRGFRIEPGEIENQLLEHHTVKEAFVMTRQYENGEAYLCAYIVPDSKTQVKEQGQDEDTLASELRDYLLRNLPDYMVPSYFIEIEQMPLNPNRKIDAKALPSPDVSTRARKYIAPRDEVEEKLENVWREILKLEAPAGIDDNFFESGGHSLKASRLLARIHKEFDVEIPLADIFKTSTIRGLAAYIRRREVSAYAPIQAAPVKEYYPLSPGQKRLFILQQMETECESTVYNMPGVLVLEGQVDKEKFEQVFKQLITRHESLRTSFQVVDGEPVQKIHSPGEIQFKINFSEGIDLNAPNFADQFIHPFDLSQAPLLRASLGQVEKEKYLLVVDMHHIISDGSSLALFIEEFIALYKGEELPPLVFQYKDYSEWLIDQLAKDAFKEQELFWLDQFSGEIPVLHLPLDYPRPAVQDFVGKRCYFEIGEEEATALQAFALRENVTLYMVLLAAFNIMCARLSGQEDIVVGSPILGRRHTDLSRIIGMFVNMLALRNKPAAGKQFDEFLHELSESAAAAFENQEYQFEELVGKLSITRDAGRNPLFDVAFAMQNIDIPQIEIPGLKLSPQEYHSGAAKFDITFDCEILAAGKDTLQEVEPGSAPASIPLRGLRIMVEYAVSLFMQETIDRFISYFRQIITSIIKNSQVSIGDIQVISEEEKQQLLYKFNDTGETYPTSKTIHGLFMEQVQKTPQELALVHKGQQLTYAGLDAKTSILAHSLIEQGMQPGDLVGIMVERSIEMIVGIIGILKSGCGYVPMNPKAPLARNRFLMEECDVEILLTAPEILQQSQNNPGEEDGFIDPKAITIQDIGMIAGLESDAQAAADQPAQAGIESQPAAMTGDNAAQSKGAISTPPDSALPQPDAQQTAYVIFTSGSTGKPKGVPITHSNFCPLIHYGYRHLGIGPGERAIQNLSYYFDWSVWEIFITLTTGAALFMAEEQVLLDPAACIDFMDEHKISILHITPTQYQYIVGQGRKIESMRYLFIGAEKLTYDLVERSLASVNEECRVFNMYGPTEATIISAELEIKRNDVKKYKRLSSVPIGPPVANVDLFILDSRMQLCPINVPGELYISGDGLSGGYLKDPEKTAAAFVDNPFRVHGLGGEKLYKTGDRARWLSDGTVEFIGRIDYQVKIRGFRIEPGEIENRLLENPAVKEAVVIDLEKEDGDKYLCAYIVPTEPGREPRDEIREYLSKGLPDYMVPSFFVFLDNIPLNPNAKVDRKALPLPEMVPGEEDYVAPRNELEEKMVQLWAGELDLDPQAVGIDTDFFEVGGHSLKATMLVSKINRDLGCKLKLTDIFQMPTIRTLAAHITAQVEPAAAEKKAAIPLAVEKEYYAVSAAQKQLYIFQVMNKESKTYNMPSILSMEGKLDIDLLNRTFLALIERHEGLRTSFHMVGGEPVQRIDPPGKIQFKIGTVSPVDTGQAASDEASWLATQVEQFVRPFDLSQAPLIRVALSKIDEQKNILLIDMHHIISDGTSVGVFMRDFMSIYEAGGQATALPQLTHTYKDFAEWQGSEAGKALIAEQEQYWLEQFTQAPPGLDIPTDLPRPSERSFEGDAFEFDLDKEKLAALNTFAKEEGVTLYMLLFAAYYILLAKLSWQEDIVVGTPVMGRKYPELHPIIGMFINALAIRNYPAADKNFKDFLQELKERTLAGFENQDYPFEDLVDKIVPNRDSSHSPIFDTMFTLQNLDLPEAQLPGLKIKEHEYTHPFSRFDITWIAIDDGKDSTGLHFIIEFANSIFTRERIEGFTGYYKEIIDIILATPDITIGDIDIAPGLVDSESTIRDEAMGDFGF